MSFCKRLPFGWCRRQAPRLQCQINSSHPGFVPIRNHENNITIPPANERIFFVHNDGRIPSVGSIFSKIGHKLWFYGSRLGLVEVKKEPGPSAKALPSKHPDLWPCRSPLGSRSSSLRRDLGLPYTALWSVGCSFYWHSCLPIGRNASATARPSDKLLPGH